MPKLRSLGPQRAPLLVFVLAAVLFAVSSLCVRAQPASCLDSLASPALLSQEPGLPACPQSLLGPPACECSGELSYCNGYMAGSQRDDAAAITRCLTAPSCLCAQLEKGTYRLKTPIAFTSKRMPGPDQLILDGARILGRGPSTVLKADNGGTACTFPFDPLDTMVKAKYSPIVDVRRTHNFTMDNLTLDVSDLLQECANNVKRIGNFVVRFNQDVEGTRLTHLVLQGQPFAGSGQLIPGGSTSGGILIIDGARSVVQSNTIRDLGYIRGLTVALQPAGSSGVTALQVANSGDSCIASNRIERVAFGIEVVNGAGKTIGDSSRTQVVGNALEGASNLENCQSCSQGRVLKLQACRDGAGGEDPAPLQDLSVRSNKACQFGGARLKVGNDLKLVQEGSGLDLICGVQFGKFRNNVLDGKNSAALFAFQLRSQFIDRTTNPPTVSLGYSEKTTTHHNLFENNQFYAGQGNCDSNCQDIKINAEAPDQLNITRLTKTSPTPGNNVFGDRFSATSGMAASDETCSMVAPTEVKIAPQGTDLTSKVTITARGVRSGTQVTLHFLQGTTDNIFNFTNTGCEMTFKKKLKVLTKGTTGTFTVTADYTDSNSRSGVMLDQPVRIVKDRLGMVTVTQSIAPTVTGDLTASPAALSFTAAVGGANPPAATVAIGSTLGQLEWEAVATAPWLTVLPSGPLTPATLTVSANAAGLAQGTYTANVFLSSLDSNQILLPVMLTVGGAASAGLTVAPTSLSFSGMAGGANPAPRTISIGSTGAPLAWTASDNAPWLSLTPASGSTPSGTQASVSLAGLAAGTYSATVTISSPGAPSVTVPVSLSVAAPPAGGSLTVNPVSFALSAPQGGPAPAQQVLAIGSTGASLAWSVADDQPWLTESPPSGSTPGATTLTINVAGLAAGTYTANVTVSAAGVPSLTVPVSLTITPVASGAPVVNGFNPISGPSGTVVEILGANLTTATAVTFNNVPAAPPRPLANGNIQATVPAGASTGLIRVTNPVDTGASFTPFTVTTGTGPTITDINPKMGPRITTAVTIFGANLTGVSSVAFGGSAASFFPAGDNFLSATVPAGAPSGSVAVTVTKNGITATSPVNFFVTDPPTGGISATASLTFNAQVGGANPPPQVFSIDSTDGAAYNWSLSDNATWLSLSPLSGTTPGSAQAAVNIAGLAAGTYNATITVSSTNAPNAPITRPVTLVLAPAVSGVQLTVTPTSIVSSTAVGVEPSIRTITIASPGSSLNWSVSSNVSWISFSQLSGTTPGSTFASFFTVAFPAGTYNATITVSAPGANPVSVPVSITVGSGGGGGGGGALSVRVTQPNGGELFQTGQQVSIQWTSTGAVSHDIAYGLNGVAFTNIVTGYTASATSYLWRIPINLVPSQDERSFVIRVTARSSTGATAQDTSDGFFSVFNPF